MRSATIALSTSRLARKRARHQLLTSLVLSSFSAFGHAAEGQGLRGCPPEDTPHSVWQDNLLKEEHALKKKIEEIKGSLYGRMDSRYLPALKRLEEVLNSEGKKAEQSKVLQETLQWEERVLGPNDPEIEKCLQLLGSATTDVRAAEEIWKRALALIPKSKDGQIDREYVLRELAETYLKQKRFSCAEQIYLSLSKDPRAYSQKEWLCALATTYEAEGKYGQACQMWKQMLTSAKESRDTKPKDLTSLYINIARVKAKAKDDAGLEAAYKQAIASKTMGHYEAYALATVMETRGKFSQALILRSKALSYLKEPYEVERITLERDAVEGLTNLLKIKEQYGPELSYQTRRLALLNQAIDRLSRQRGARI